MSPAKRTGNGPIGENESTSVGVFFPRKRRLRLLISLLVVSNTLTQPGNATALAAWRTKRVRDPCVRPTTDFLTITMSPAWKVFSAHSASRTLRVSPKQTGGPFLRTLLMGSPVLILRFASPPAKRHHCPRFRSHQFYRSRHSHLSWNPTTTSALQCAPYVRHRPG